MKKQEEEEVDEKDAEEGDKEQDDNEYVGSSTVFVFLSIKGLTPCAQLTP